MTAAAEEAWIQNSISRLEALEAQREQLAAAGQTNQLAELDEEIRALYEVLESVASDEDEAANAAAPAHAATPMMPGMAAPIGQPMAPPTVQHGAAPAMGQPMSPPMSPPMSQPMGGSEYDLDDDIKPPRSALPLVILGLLVVGGGVGGYLLTQKDEEAAKAAPVGPATIIEASAVVEDTQEPQVAKGADADRTRGTNYKESSSSNNNSSRRRSGSSSRSRTGRSSKKSDEGRKVKFENTKDPLGGVQ